MKHLLENTNHARKGTQRGRGIDIFRHVIRENICKGEAARVGNER